ncbi:MAG TPA: NAD(P)-dependent oxidoreductase [Chloroflexota bacterium]|nr:NAD(P)-dependent oxidoreductase [Chloroflexota bacterium]
MAILVTGGAGYIGRWLANELVQAGHEVVAVDVQPPPGGMPPELPAGAVWVKGDVTDKQSVADAVKLKPLSAIVHLAGIVTMGCERDPDLCMRVNLGGTANLLEAARQNGVGTFVFASTISVYGPNVSQPMVEGKTPAEPLTWYGESKILAEQLGLYYNRRWGLDFRAARMAAIVGPSRIAGSGSATMYTSLILEKAALGEPYEIDVDPEAGTPVLYARDAAKGLAALATAPSAPRRIYHLSTGLATAQELIRIARSRVPDAQLTFKTDPQLGPVSTISKDWDLSIKAAEEDLGWRPAFTVESMADDLMAIARGQKH